MIDALIFDFDGVILDTVPYHYRSWEMMLQKIGMSIEPKDNHFLMGASRLDSLDYLLRRNGALLNQHHKEALMEQKNKIYLDMISELTQEDLLPGVLSLIQEAKEQSVLVAVGSGSRNAFHILDKIGIASIFDVIIDANHVEEPKPHPQTFLDVCERLDISPFRAIVLEDSDKGIRSAHAAGCYVVGIGSEDYLKQAHYVVPSLEHTRLDDLIQNVSRDLIA